MGRMRDRIRVCQWGAFDVANYGDQLFPLIANDQLTTRLPNLELVCHAPAGVADLPPGSPPLFPLVEGGGPLSKSRREYFARHFDAVLVGGGDLLRFDRSEPGYGDSPQGGTLRPYDAFFDFRWGEPGARPTILWNAPGVPFAFEPSRHLLVRRAFSHVRHAAVRDEVSRGYLLEAGIEGPVHLAPDSGVLLAEVIGRRTSEETAREMLKRRGAGASGRKMLCFQCSPGFLRREEELVAKSLARIAKRWDLEVVLLPVGLCHGDLEALRSVQEASGNRFTLVEDVETPLEIGALIGACDYFVGSSLHGNLTALSYGIPHIVVNNPLRAAKLEGYVQLADLEDFRITGWDALEGTFDRLAAAPPTGWTSRRDRLKVLANEHFDRLAELIAQAAAQRGEPERYSGSRPEGEQVNEDIPLQAYETIAGLHERLDDERAARRHTEVELRDSKVTLRQRHLAHREQLERAGARSKHLEREIETLKVRNEGLRERIREMENSTIWRLFGPYRRLLSALGARGKRAAGGAHDEGPAQKLLK